MSEKPQHQRRTSSDIQEINTELDAPPPTARRRSSSTDKPRSRGGLTVEKVLHTYSSIPSASSMLSVNDSVGEDKEFRKMDVFKDEIVDCVCQQVVPSSDAVHCGLCQNTIPALFHQRRLRLKLYEQLEVKDKILKDEKERCVRLVHETTKQELRISELEDHIANYKEEIRTLERDVRNLSGKLVKEIEKRADVQAELDKTKEELEDLTQSLFEQANGMVSDAAKRRHEVEQNEKRLKKELQEATKKLESRESENHLLKKRISELSLRENGSSASSPNLGEKASSTSTFQRLLSQVSQSRQKSSSELSPPKTPSPSKELNSDPNTE